MCWESLSVKMKTEDAKLKCETLVIVTWVNYFDGQPYTAAKMLVFDECAHCLMAKFPMLTERRSCAGLHLGLMPQPDCCL